MAGAVSAGAYTAGVLDFLVEALEQWYAAKASGSPAVPMHDLSLDVVSGASAGGMCASIAAVMVQGNFQHIRNPEDDSIKDTTNKFYESWVNKIDIEWLLQARDLADGGPVTSLLDSTIIDEIADYAIAPVPGAEWRPYISEALTLFLTLTNVRGVPFSLNGGAEGSAEESIAYYADRLEFETVRGTAKPRSDSAKPLPVGTCAGAWLLLKEAAKATGAFPIFLAPRQIDRVAKDYLYSPWEPISNPHPDLVPPHWALDAQDTYRTLNVDGGVTNNDPFRLAHDFLAVRNPLAWLNPDTGILENPRDAGTANCAVLTVAPFPAESLFDGQYDFASNSSVFGMLPNLFTVLIGQSRFLGESLSSVVNSTGFSRFVLAPSDPENTQQNALQCGLLAAFGGFFERGFRAHDYQLGRRNCQKFLRDYFRLSADNPIIAAGMARVDPAARDAITARFDPGQTHSLPIIPLCGTAEPEVPRPEPARIAQARVGDIVNWIVSRLHSIAKPLLDSALGHGVESWTARQAVDVLISTAGRAKFKEILNRELQGFIAG